MNIKVMRVSLAVTSGLFLALSYITNVRHDDLSFPKILIGLVFGTGFATSMLRQPERHSLRTVLWLTLPTVAILLYIAVELHTGPGRYLIVAAALAFLVSQCAFGMLPKS